MKVGRITVALSLIAAGAGLALDNLGVTASSTTLILKLWPLVLIGFGLEYLWALRQEEARDKGFDLGGAILLFLVVSFVFVRGLPGLVITGLPDILAGPLRTNISRTESVAQPAAGVLELKVSTGVGGIELRPGADQIRVEATLSGETEEDLLDVRVKVSSGAVAEVSLEGVRPGRRVQASYVITAPPGLKVDAETGTGSLRVTGYQGDLSLTSGAGSVRLDDVAGNVKVGSGTGSVSITGHRGGSLDARTNTGSITVQTGGVLQGDVHLQTGTGSITLQVPAGSSMRVGARTGTGSLTAPDFVAVTRSGASRQGAGTSGSGTYSVDLQTSTGSIRLEER